jgi:hypothetical protein
MRTLSAWQSACSRCSANEWYARTVQWVAIHLSVYQSDMSREEDLSTKLRTLSYDHERLMTMHRSATEKAANAEREMNVYKSRLA